MRSQENTCLYFFLKQNLNIIYQYREIIKILKDSLHKTIFFVNVCVKSIITNKLLKYLNIENIRSENIC